MFSVRGTLINTKNLERMGGVVGIESIIVLPVQENALKDGQENVEMEKRLEAIEEKIDRMEKNLSDKLDMLSSLIVAIQTGDVNLK